MDWPELKATVKLDSSGTVLLGVNENKSDITDIVIPEGVEEIADSALAHCYHLKSVHKGDGSFCVHVAQELLTNINKNTSRSLLK